ncbi:MAG: DUF4317 family protein, partial [Lachnospiraceae bacterium]|nr:DUF4317 family protein [Lachnospiraceae bacterium]
KEGIPLTAPIVLSADIIDEVIEENNIDEEQGAYIKKTMLNEFADEMPEIANLVDSRALKANEPVKREKELVKEVIELKNKLEDVTGSALSRYSVVLTVPEEKAGLVRAEYINDTRYLIIPFDEDEHASVNGQLLDND